jgi:hypothetical protein
MTESNGRATLDDILGVLSTSLRQQADTHRAMVTGFERIDGRLAEITSILIGHGVLSEQLRQRVERIEKHLQLEPFQPT